MKNIIIFSSLTPTKKECARISNIVERSGKNKRIAYIPAGFESLFVGADARGYGNMGFKTYVVAPIGRNFDEDRFNFALESDAIHLGGGNTFEFLYMLQVRELLQPLRDFVNRGGILMGTSAGGIMMCNKIRIAGFADDNFLGLHDEELNSLGLVDFEVKPHWNYWKDIRPQFQKYVKNTGETLFCLEEGQSIWVTENSIKFYGGMPEKIGDGSYNWKMKVF